MTSLENNSMSNKYSLPEKEVEKIRERDKTCVYCHKAMIYPL